MIQSIPTKDRILDSAEKLFGNQGFESTSLRDITTDANANLAAVNYYFQSKDSLVDAVIARRVEPVNRKRLEMLDAAERGSVEQILTAFLEPVLELELEQVIPLLGRVLANRSQFLERVYHRHFALVVIRFRDALAKALPELSDEDIFWRMQFMVGTITHVLNWGFIFPRMSGGLCNISDRKATLERMVPFLAAGFRANGGRRSASKGEQD